MWSVPSLSLSCSYGDFTTQSSSAVEGLWFANGTLQSHKVELLTRTYAKVGVPPNLHTHTSTPHTSTPTPPHSTPQHSTPHTSTLHTPPPHLHTTCTCTVHICTYTYTCMQAVSGKYLSQSFSPDTSDFTLSFTARTTLSHAPTVIYLNEKIHYPTGFVVRWVRTLQSIAQNSPPQ